ncbi:MAG TPA: DUF1569 domain-containing protein [Flavipsychrobacter sp.]|nr:DUF1569 domain-containing protein [Flavipsychrobacter sp.]
MKTLYQDSDYKELAGRLSTLTLDAQRQWGKMNVSQTLGHCCEPLEVAMGTKVIKRLLIGRILGPLAKPSYVGEKPFDKNGPTAKEFLIRDERDFNTEKAKLEKLMKAFHDGGPAGATTNPHAFFGKLTKEEWGIIMYKHLDHHLRQFGV